MEICLTIKNEVKMKSQIENLIKQLDDVLGDKAAIIVVESENKEMFRLVTGDEKKQYELLIQCLLSGGVIGSQILQAISYAIIAYSKQKPDYCKAMISEFQSIINKTN